MTEKNTPKEYSRKRDLEKKMNNFLSKITNVEKDYMKNFSQNDLLELKSALSDINNILTLETTRAFVNWLNQLYSFSDSELKEIIHSVETTKPNTNGFDIEITKPNKKILTEIKCIVPINNSDKFGVAQKNAILDDALKLINGKKNLKNTESYHKFIGLIDIDNKTDNAIHSLIKPVQTITKNQQQIARNEVISKIKYIDNNIKIADISTEFVYIKRIKIE